MKKEKLKIAIVLATLSSICVCDCVNAASASQFTDTSDLFLDPEMEDFYECVDSDWMSIVYKKVLEKYRENGSDKGYYAKVELTQQKDGWQYEQYNSLYIWIDDKMKIIKIDDAIVGKNKVIYINIDKDGTMSVTSEPITDATEISVKLEDLLNEYEETKDFDDILSEIETSSDTEESKEKIDMGNIRSAYQEVMSEWLANNCDKSYYTEVKLSQQEDGWQFEEGIVYRRVDGVEYEIPVDNKIVGKDKVVYVNVDIEGMVSVTETPLSGAIKL